MTESVKTWFDGVSERYILHFSNDNVGTGLLHLPPSFLTTF